MTHPTTRRCRSVYVVAVTDFSPCQQPLAPRPLPRAGRFCITAGLMSLCNQGRLLGRAALIVVLAMTTLGTVGCDQFNARREVQDGNQLYKDGKFEEAAKKFEDAVAKVPALDIAHHNLGLTYAKLFSPGLKTPANQEMADKAANELGIYLKTNPKDNTIRAMMTHIWIDAGNFQKALDYWEKEHNTDPTNADVMSKLAGIEFKAGNWEKSMGWYRKQAEATTDSAAKVAAFQAIGNVAWAVLSNREKNVGEVRFKAADLGVAALSEAALLAPKKPEIQGLIIAIYNFRALGQGESWAAAIDRASAQDHMAQQRVLVEEIKKEQAAAALAAPATTAPAATGAPAAGG